MVTSAAAEEQFSQDGVGEEEYSQGYSQDNCTDIEVIGTEAAAMGAAHSLSTGIATNRHGGRVSAADVSVSEPPVKRIRGGDKNTGTVVISAADTVASLSKRATASAQRRRAPLLPIAHIQHIIRSAMAVSPPPASSLLHLDRIVPSAIVLRSYPDCGKFRLH